MHLRGWEYSSIYETGCLSCPNLVLQTWRFLENCQFLVVNRNLKFLIYIRERIYISISGIKVNQLGSKRKGQVSKRWIIILFPSPFIIWLPPEGANYIWKGSLCINYGNQNSSSSEALCSDDTNCGKLTFKLTMLAIHIKKAVFRPRTASS